MSPADTCARLASLKKTGNIKCICPTQTLLWGECFSLSAPPPGSPSEGKSSRLRSSDRNAGRTSGTRLLPRGIAWVSPGASVKLHKGFPAQLLDRSESWLVDGPRPPAKQAESPGPGPSPQEPPGQSQEGRSPGWRGGAALEHLDGNSGANSGGLPGARAGSSRGGGGSLEQLLREGCPFSWAPAAKMPVAGLIWA